ncbi:MAG: hypothetical protein ABEI99_05735, partial [Halobaculum sp.]
MGIDDSDGDDSERDDDSREERSADRDGNTPRSRTATVRSVVRSLVDDVRTGLSSLRHSTLAAVVAVSVGINLVMPAYGLLFAAVGDRVFGAALAYTALLVSYEVGKVLGNGVAPRLDWSRVVAVRRGVLLCGVATVALGVGGELLRTAATATLSAVCVGAAAVGATQPLFNVPSDSLVQTLVPADHRGTVVTVTNALYQLPFPLAGSSGIGWVRRHRSGFSRRSPPPYLSRWPVTESHMASSSESAFVSWYRNRIGDPLDDDEVYGYWLFVAGLVLGVAGLVLFISGARESTP